MKTQPTNLDALNGALKEYKQPVAVLEQEMKANLRKAIDLVDAKDGKKDGIITVAGVERVLEEKILHKPLTVEMKAVLESKLPTKFTINTHKLDAIVDQAVKAMDTNHDGIITGNELIQSGHGGKKADLAALAKKLPQVIQEVHEAPQAQHFASSSASKIGHAISK